MKKMIKKVIFILVLLTCILWNYSYATNEVIINENMISEIQKYMQGENIDTNNLTEDDILDIYEEFTQNYSNDEIIEIIENNREKLNKKGISDSTIDTGKKIIQTTDEEDIKKIIKENIDVKDIQEKIEEGYTAEQIVGDIINEMPTKQKINIAGKLILSNKIVKMVITILIALFIYGIVITMYDICDLSLGYMLLWLVPIIGWLILFIIAIVKRIYLAKNFGKGIFFGIGLILLPTIFQSIIAFNKNIKYIEE